MNQDLASAKSFEAWPGRSGPRPQPRPYSFPSSSPWWEEEMHNQTHWLGQREQINLGVDLICFLVRWIHAA